MPPSSSADRTGWLDQTQPSRSRMSGSGGGSRRRSPRPEVEQRGREQAAGAQMARARARAREPLVRSGEELKELHRGQHEVEPAAEVERAGVRRRPLRRRRSAPPRAGAAPPTKRRRRGRARSRRCPRRGEVEATRPVPQPRSSTLQAPARSRRAASSAPELEVGRVGAALEVVPDDRRDLRLGRSRPASFPERLRLAARRRAAPAARAARCRSEARRAGVRRRRASERSRPSLERRARPRSAPRRGPRTSVAARARRRASRSR